MQIRKYVIKDTATIYSITNIVKNKRYVGKTMHPKQRWNAHKHLLTSERHYNRHLSNAVKKYGIDNFKFEILEQFENINNSQLKEKELSWMDFYKSYEREHGYNLRRDSATNCFMAEETKILQSINMRGSKNSNFGNKWSKFQKEQMSNFAKKRHKSGLFYTKEWKTKVAVASSLIWKNGDKKNKMAHKLKFIKRKFVFDQYTRDGVFVKTWNSVEDIILKNPSYKWQNIYSVCNGYKSTYMNFQWVKRLPGVEKINSIKPKPKGKYFFEQWSIDNKFIKKWESTKDIITENPNFNRNLIYRTANGYHASYKGFKWIKVEG